MVTSCPLGAPTQKSPGYGSAISRHAAPNGLQIRGWSGKMVGKTLPHVDSFTTLIDQWPDSEQDSSMCSSGASLCIDNCKAKENSLGLQVNNGEAFH